MNYSIPLHPGRMYHIISHAVGNEQLFRENENYRFFLDKYFFYTLPVADTITYCLMPNHFHFMIRIRPEKDIGLYYWEKKNCEAISEVFPDFIMQQFSNLLNSYAKAYNKVYKRRGSLFVDNLRRFELESEKYFTALVLYIHHNPVKHCFCRSANKWKWSGYNEMLDNSITHLRRNEVLEWFGGRDSFIRSHEAQ